MIQRQKMNREKKGIEMTEPEKSYNQQLQEEKGTCQGNFCKRSEDI